MFKTLKSWGYVTEVIGWIVGSISTLLLLIALATALTRRGQFESGLAIASMIPTFAGIVAGIYFIVSGQAVRCFVAIEENTRETNRLLRSPQAPKKAEVLKRAVGATILGLTDDERAAEAEVQRLAEAARQKPSAVRCPGCGKTYPLEFPGRFCEECGTKL